MSISFDPIFTVNGVRTGGVAVVNSAMTGLTTAGFFAASMCSSTTRSSPRLRCHGIPSGETIGPRPGAHPMNCPSGSWTVGHDMPLNPGWPSRPSCARDAPVRSTRITA